MGPATLQRRRWNGLATTIGHSVSQKGERCLRDIITSAGKRYIPDGRIPNPLPGFPAAAARLADERDHLHATDPTNQDIARLNQNISKLTKEYRCEKWRDYLRKIDNRCGAKRLWSAVRSLTRPRPRTLVLASIMGTKPSTRETKSPIDSAKSSPPFDQTTETKLCEERFARYGHSTTNTNNNTRMNTCSPVNRGRLHCPKQTIAGLWA